MQSAITHGVKVSVESFFQHQQSDAEMMHFVFAYRVSILNNSDETIILRRRHWYITDSLGHKREVEGEGVVGEQPVLATGQSFEYTSGCPLTTPFGTMHGTYQMTTM